MDEKAWISLVSAIVSVIALCVTIFFSLRARSVSLGTVEISLRASITTTRQAVRRVGEDLNAFMDGRRDDELNAQEKRKKALFDSILNEALEDLLNAYETACAQYIDKKVDRKRFRKTYHKEIANLCEASQDHRMHKLMHPETTCKWRPIWIVYREWHHLEK